MLRFLLAVMVVCKVDCSNMGDMLVHYSIFRLHKGAGMLKMSISTEPGEVGPASQLDQPISTRYGVRQDMCPNGGAPMRSNDGNIKWCRLDAECRNNYDCVPIVGLQHFGNPVKYCCPTKYSYCSRKPMPRGLGDCAKPAVTMYYFDTNRLKCRPYVVAGCDRFEAMVDEVQNRFGTLKDCRAKCETTACEIGESPLYKDDDFDRPHTCTNNDNCPFGYMCRYDKLFRRQICCGKTAFDPCPGFRTFIVPFSGKPKECNPLNKERDECPTDHLCTSSNQNTLSYCCSRTQGVCPTGQKPYIHPLTGNTIKCNPHSYDAACPSGYVCAATIIGSSWGFCCSQALVANCPRNTKPYINIATNMPQRCTVGVTMCNHGYLCQNTEVNSAVGFCCTPPNSAEVVLRPQPTSTAPPAMTTAAGRILVVERRSEEDETEESGQEKAKATTESLEFSKEDRSTFEELQRTVIERIRSTEYVAPSTPRPTTPFPTPRPKTVRSQRLKASDLQCPEDFRAMTYPQTGLIMHCSRERKTDCPVPSKCLRDPNDHLHRALCCLHRDDRLDREVSEESAEDGSSVKIVESIQFGQSEDSACPTIILSRQCTPGSIRDCPEDTFFCQFNKQFGEFLCCSLYQPSQLKGGAHGG